jgi:hypothetical protein
LGDIFTNHLNWQAIGRRIALEVLGQGRYEVVDEIVAPDIRNHGGVPEGRDGLKATG